MVRSPDRLVAGAEQSPMRDGLDVVIVLAGVALLVFAVIRLLSP